MEELKMNDNQKIIEAIERHIGDIGRLCDYLAEHEDTDTALMQNAGLNTYPSVILGLLLK